MNPSGPTTHTQPDGDKTGSLSRTYPRIRPPLPKIDYVYAHKSIPDAEHHARRVKGTPSEDAGAPGGEVERGRPEDHRAANPGSRAHGCDRAEEPAAPGGHRRAGPSGQGRPPPEVRAAPAPLLGVLRPGRSSTARRGREHNHRGVPPR